MIYFYNYHIVQLLTNQHLMDRNIKLIFSFFMLIILISLAGFYTSYISHLPNFSHFPLLIHLHFIGFVGWFVLLIIQPILIAKGKRRLHRSLGKTAYVLIPLLIISILLLVLQQTEREFEYSIQKALMTSFIGFIDALSLGVYFTIAMMNSRNQRWHVAFIIACSLVILNPGMSRLLNQIHPGSGLLAASLLPILVSFSILIFEKINYQKPILKSPYLLFLGCWIAEILLLMIIPRTDFWKNFVLAILQ